MFQFPAFPIAQSNCKRIPIRRSQVLPLHAGPLGLSQLGTSFIGSQAERSTSWHSSHVLRIGYVSYGCTTCDPGTGPVDAWTTRTHGLICTPVDGRPALTLPIHTCAGWCIGSFGLDRRRLSHLRDSVSIRSETWTHRDSNPGHPPCKGGTLPLSYGPTPTGSIAAIELVGDLLLALIVLRCSLGRRVG